MSKRIILACSIINYGGVGKMICYVASILLAKGWKVMVISLMHEQRPAFLHVDAEYLSLTVPRFKNVFLWRAEEIIKLRRTLKKLTPFIICTFGSEPSVIVRIATLGMRKTTVVSAERSDPYTLPLLWKHLSSWAYKHSDFCVFQLDKQRDFYNELDKKKCFVIPNAFIPKGCNLPIIPEKLKVVISAGRFVYQKGFDTLIKAFAIVSERHPDYTLELYGGGDEQTYYNKIIEEQNLIGKVYLHDYVQNIIPLIAKCKVFVLSSRFEGIPNVLIEAMSLGVPTVSTDCTPGGPAFLTNNGERGLLVAVDDVHSMAEAICSIIENPELSDRLSVAGKEIINLLDEKVIAEKWIEMFSIIS